MATLQQGTVDAWASSLTRLETLLDLTDWEDNVGLSPASADESEVADALEPRFVEYERESERAEAETELVDDLYERNRLLSTLAIGDLKAAVVAFEMAQEFEEGGVEPADWEAPSPEDRIAGALAAQLTTEPQGASGTDSDWSVKLTASLDKVVDESAERIVKVAEHGITSKVGGVLGSAMLDLANGRLGEHLDKAKAQLKRLKKWAMQLLKKGLTKIASLFGADVREAIEEWAQNWARGVPKQLVRVAAGVEDTIEAWKGAAERGIDVASLLPRVASSEGSKLEVLGWSDLGIKAYAYSAGFLIGAQFAGVPGTAIIAVIALALVGLMIWAAYDHSHDAERLVAAPS